MSEQSRPKPFPEARPPHLPDVLTRQSPWLLFFGTVMVLVTWRWWTSISLPPEFGIGSAIQHALASISSIVPPLLGFALFWRHPDARHRMPLLVFGLVLLAVGELLGAFNAPISQFLFDLAPPSDADIAFSTPAQFAFTVFTALLSVFALLYVGAGIASSRARERGPVERPLTIWLAALSVLATVFSLVSLTAAQFEPTPMLVAQAISGTILSALVTFAWAYVTVVTVNGWIAGERPRRAWLLAAIGTSTLFALRLIFPALALIPLDATALPVLSVIAYVSYAGWLLLAAAFLLGLPTPSSSNDVAEPTVDPPAATQPGSAAG